MRIFQWLLLIPWSCQTNKFGIVGPQNNERKMGNIRMRAAILVLILQHITTNTFGTDFKPFPPARPPYAPARSSFNSSAVWVSLFFAASLSQRQISPNTLPILTMIWANVNLSPVQISRPTCNNYFISIFFYLSFIIPSHNNAQQNNSRQVSIYPRPLRYSP